MNKNNFRTLSLLLLLLAFIFTPLHLHAAANWASVELLIKQEKFSIADQQLAELLSQAKTNKDFPQWTRALVEQAKLKIARDEFEAAVVLLQEQEWPEDKKSQVILALFYAKALSRYIQQDSWEIRQREPIESKSKVTFKKMTLEQLLTETNRAYETAWQSKELWSELNTDASNHDTHYFETGNYPQRIRGTFRDTLTYLWTDFISHESLWSASHSNQKATLKLASLLMNLDAAEKHAPMQLGDQSIHPILRSLWLLTDLEHWHQQNNRPEAALEAARMRIHVLHQTMPDQQHRSVLVKTLRARIEQDAKLPWSTMAQWSLAQMLKKSASQDALIQSKAVLDDCMQNHLHSAGTERCKSLADDILQPKFKVQAMRSDGLQKRSIVVNHKNLKKLYFRAWKVDLHAYQKQSGQDEDELINQLLLQPKADASWSKELPATVDYHLHRTYVIPPMKQLGYWLLLASDDVSFDKKKSSMSALRINLTAWVAEANITDDALEVTVYQGKNGQRVPNVKAELWQSKHTQPKRRVAVATTDKEGQAQLTGKEEGFHFILLSDTSSTNGGTSKDSAWLENIYHSPVPDNPSAGSKTSLTFTDRSIYRPDQHVQWKVVAYQENSPNGGYRILPNATGWVELLDTHWDVVVKKSIKTNEFGSASGEFLLKPGSLLGSWHIRTSWNEVKDIRVEEYKRPTFAVQLNTSDSVLRLDEPAKITGSAQYFFGQPVTAGKIKWSVTRSPVYSDYKTNRGYSRPEVLTSGTTEVNNKGDFSIEFLAASAENAQANVQTRAQKYAFILKAEITDSGGETRSAKRTYHVGDVSIEASIQAENPFVVAGMPYSLDLVRTDLDGTPRAGEAWWTLHPLQQPSLVMPVDIPIELEADKARFATPGDKLLPRWKPDQDNSLPWTNWQAGKSITQGTLQHNKEGNAKLELTTLPAGLYRLHYTTKDAWGKRFQTQQDIMIVSPGDNTPTPISVASILQVKASQVDVGENIELLVGSGFKDVAVMLDVYHGEKRIQHYRLKGGIQRKMFPVLKEHEGSLTFVTKFIKDYQLITKELHVSVPKKDYLLDVSFSTFRDKLLPGQKEKWRITVKDTEGKPLTKGAAEVLASMYDKSLDFFAHHHVFDIASLYPENTVYLRTKSTQGSTYPTWWNAPEVTTKEDVEAFKETRLANYEKLMRRFAEKKRLAEYGADAGTKHTHPPIADYVGSITHTHTGGSAVHHHKYSLGPKAAMAAGSVNVHALQRKLRAKGYYTGPISGVVTPATRAALQQYMDRGGEPPGKQADTSAPVVVRTNFNETAFFYPHLILDEKGSVSFEFEVPESLTAWKVWVLALTKDMRGGSISEQVRTSKDLVVRSYLPRFLREGDQPEIEVVVNNSGEKALTGQLDFEILNPETGESRADDFKLENAQRAFDIQPGDSTHLRFTLSTPKQPGLIAIRTKAQTGEFSDGEQRPLAILPSRIHLAQNQFVTLTDKDSKTLSFDELTENNDATRNNDKLVVNVEGQLFYSALNALPYLTDYPYQCTEQTLNRYLSTAIVKSVLDTHPAVATMAKKLSKRDRQYDKWNDKDANRSMLLEETPWLTESEGGEQSVAKLFRILDPAIANEQRKKSLEKLRTAQTSTGGFPWWPGGPASVYSTQYTLAGFARALEFSAPADAGISKKMVKRAWKYLYNKSHHVPKNETQNKLNNLTRQDLTHITFTNYLLSTYPDISWTGNRFSRHDRQTMLAFSFKYWRDLAPLLKSYLALTLHRDGRHQDAILVFDSVMDSAKTDPQLGTYWVPEARSWLWYNDPLETHAFILRTLMELNPQDMRRHGIVQWLMLDKKLNHWKSTRATAESIYALVHYLKQEGSLGTEEKASLNIGENIHKTLIFKPNEYTGHHNQIIIPRDNIKPDMGKITVKKDSKGLMFVSATWHYSTEKLPKQTQGDFFHIMRKFYKRIQKDKKWTLQPLAEGAVINVGDQLEVQLSLRTKHHTEYIHLRSPRGAGFEPMSNISEYKRDQGISYYEEIRDSGANYFFEHLPAGEYSFKHRLRATTAGRFQTAPAIVQSIYAPEFVAYSSGEEIQIK